MLFSQQPWAVLVPARCRHTDGGLWCLSVWVFVKCNLRQSSYLRLRERGLMAGERRPSSSVMLSELKCLVRKCSSSGVGWKGSWCSFSWDEQEDCERRSTEGAQITTSTGATAGWGWSGAETRASLGQSGPGELVTGQDRWHLDLELLGQSGRVFFQNFEAYRTII